MMKTFLCVNCGEENDVTNFFCGNCGTRLAAGTKQGAKTCSKCISENPSSYRFCGYCGTNLDASCPHCKAIVPIDYQYCPNCAYLCGEGRHGVSEVLEIKNVSKFFGEGTTKVVALHDVSLQIRKGDFVAIMGPSGSGKSTFLNILGGLDHVSGGEVILEGKRIDNLDENSLVNIRRGKIAYVFQQYHLLPSLTALENVLLPLIFRGTNSATDKALEMLDKVRLKKRAMHKPSQLSGGEQQRVAIARALVSDPSLILADEPTGNMDRKTGKEILGLFEQLNKEGNTIIMVTHDSEAASNAKQIVIMQDGQIVDKIDNEKGRLEVN